MGTDSGRATPAPRPHSAMGASKRDGHDGGVKVVVRTRPANQFELKEDGNKVCFTVATDTTCMLEVHGKSEPYTFTFDNVFGQHSRQIEVFEAAGIPTVENVLKGYNSTIFAYGQTGAGKTHTMLGKIKDEELRGLTPRVFEYLFKKIDEERAAQNPPPEYKVVCSNLEIYNETITDLLTPGSSNLQLRNDTKMGSGTYVDGLKEVVINSADDALDLMEEGTNNRTVSATNANLTSSRSHCVFTCVVTRKQKSADGSENQKISRLNLVDLAGSERAKVSDGKDAQTLKEGCNINKSLTCLGRVIKELVDSQRKGGKAHVPYRDSKLTALLQESLGGNARTTIIAGVSPMFSASGESLSTLQFVQRAKHIKNKAKANEALKMDPQALQIEVLKLRAQIEKMKKGGYSTAGLELEPSEPEPAVDPELMAKLEREEERVHELETELMSAKIAKENSSMENTKLKNEIGVLRDLKTELQSNINEMMEQFNGWQDKITEAEEITKKVFDAERAAIMDEIQVHKNRISEQENEKKERDFKIGELQGDLKRVMTDLTNMTKQNEELAKGLDVANKTLDERNNQIGQLKQDYSSVSASLKESEAACADLDKKLSDANSLIKSKTSELESVEAELARARSTISDIENDNSSLREQIKGLENTRSELKKTISETEMMVQQLQREKQELQDSLEFMKQSVAELEKASDTLRTQISDQSKIIRERDSELKDLKSQLQESQNSCEELENKINLRDSAISDMENTNSRLHKTIEHKEFDLSQLRKNLTESQNQLQMVETQRTELEAKVAHYVEMSKQQREEASALRAEFENAQIEYQEQLEAKDEALRRAHANFEAQLKAREARLAEAAKHFDEEKQRMQEEHQSIITELHDNIEHLSAERDRKIRQHKDELKEWEAKYKTSIEDYECRLEEKEKKANTQSEEYQAIIRRKEHELRETQSRLNSDIAELEARLEEETAKYEIETCEKKKAMNERLDQYKKETKHQIRQLQSMVDELKFQVEEKDSRIDDLESKRSEDVRRFESRIRSLQEKYNTEIKEKNDELESVTHLANTQVDTLERELEEAKKKHQAEVRYRENKIASLEEQLGEKEEFRNYLDEYSCALHRYSQLNSTLYGVLEGINNTLASVETSRPPSVASSYMSYDDRYDYDMAGLNSGSYGKTQTRNGADTAFQIYNHDSFSVRA